MLSRFSLLIPLQTHKLSYSYCRATMGVSYASPTYYADRLCERAALYVKDLDNGSVPWHVPKLRNADRSFAHDAHVQGWFEELERRFYKNRDIPDVPAWARYAPWGSGVADTMFWM